jgi:hypoxanthine phosphoribosyltransferase
LSGGTIWTGSGPYRMSWDDFGVLMIQLAGQVRRDGFRPDVICAVARGGLMPAGFLAATLEVARMEIVRVRRTVDDRVYADKQLATMDHSSGSSLNPGDRVLIVDDVAGTGQTAALVDDYVRGEAAEVRCAVLAHNPRSSYRPDYRAVEIDDWIVFPWEPASAGVIGRPLQLGLA